MSFLSKICPCLNNDDDPVVPPRVWTAQALGWTFINSGPMDYGRNADDNWYFEFPTEAPGVHGVVGPAPSANRSGVKLLFNITAQEGTKFIPVGDPNPDVLGKVRLFIQRRGDDWSGAGAFASYRFYSGPLDLAPGNGELTVPLSPEFWTNVYGQRDDAGFAAVLADLSSVGFGLGGSNAMHGVYVYGSARFTIFEYALT